MMGVTSLDAEPQEGFTKHLPVGSHVLRHQKLSFKLSALEKELLEGGSESLFLCSEYVVPR